MNLVTNLPDRRPRRGHPRALIPVTPATMRTFDPLRHARARREHGFQAFAVSGAVATRFGLHTRFGRFPLQGSPESQPNWLRTVVFMGLTSRQTPDYDGIMMKAA